MWKPEPMNMEDVTLPEELLALWEQVAKGVHDNWAQQRIREGWTWGERRDDRLKTTPCLVPYEELPDSEREYDRSTAMQTLKLILALGYRIEKT